MRKMAVRMAMIAVALTISVNAQAKAETDLKETMNFELKITKKATPKKMLSKLEPKEVLYMKKIIVVDKNKVTENKEYSTKTNKNNKGKNDLIVYIGAEDSNNETISVVSIQQYEGQNILSQNVLFVPAGKVNTVPVAGLNGKKQSELCYDLTGTREDVNCTWSVSFNKID